MAGWGYCRYCQQRIHWGTNPNGNGRAFPFDDEEETQVHFETCSARARVTDPQGNSHTTSKCSECSETVWWETMASGSKRPMNVDGDQATWTCHFDTCGARAEPEAEPKRKQRHTRAEQPKEASYSVRLWLPDLELNWPCTVADATSAFRRLAMIHHPDVGGTSADFIRIRNAYDRLKELLPAA